MRTLSFNSFPDSRGDKRIAAPKNRISLSIPFRIPELGGAMTSMGPVFYFQFLSGFQFIRGAKLIRFETTFQFLSGFQRSLITVGYGSIYVYPIIFSTFVEIYCS